MTDQERERYDRIDRQLEFLAAHQAQLSSDVAQLYRVTALHSEQIAENGKQIAANTLQIADNTQQMAAINRQIATLGDQTHSLADSVLRVARIVDERDRQTDAKINSLISVVERYFSNGKKERS